MKRNLFLAAMTAVAISACETGDPQRDHELACVGGTMAGAVVGGLAGSAFGSGTGNVVMTAAGATAGGVAGNRLACK